MSDPEEETPLEHLRAVFGTVRNVEQLGYELRIAADVHTQHACTLRHLAADGVYDQPNSVITRAGAELLAHHHSTAAATLTAMAGTVDQALHPDLQDE